MLPSIFGGRALTIFPTIDMGTDLRRYGFVHEAEDTIVRAEE